MYKWIKNTKHITKLPLLVLSLLLAACAGGPPKPVVDFKPDYNFTGVKTYAFSPGESVGASTLVGGRVEKAIAAQMKRQGIAIAEPEKADVLVRFMLMTQDKQDVRTYNRYYGGAAYNCWRCGPTMGSMGTEVQVHNYTEGTLVIDIIDTALKRTVWHAISKGKVNKNLSPDERNERVLAVVGNMFAEYPPTLQ